MNITESIAKQIGGHLEEFISKTPEIQMYANDNIKAYQWRDTRFEESSDVWAHPEIYSREELIGVIKNHIRKKMVEKYLAMPNDSVSDYEDIRQIALLTTAFYSGLTEHETYMLNAKVKKEFAYAGLYPHTQLAQDITPEGLYADITPEPWSCYEIWRPNIPDNGCSKQCTECKQKQEELARGNNNN